METGIRRRRACDSCDKRWTTAEVMEDVAGGYTVLTAADAARTIADQHKVDEASSMLRVALEVLDRTSGLAGAILRGIDLNTDSTR